MSSRSAEEVFARIPGGVIWQLPDNIPERFDASWPPPCPVELKPATYDADIAAVFSTHSIYKNVSTWYKPQNALEFAGDRLISSAVGCMLLDLGLAAGGCDWISTRLVSRRILSLLGIAYNFHRRLLYGRMHWTDGKMIKPTQSDIEDAFEALVAVVYKRRVMRQWLEELMAPFLCEALRTLPDHHRSRQASDLAPTMVECSADFSAKCVMPFKSPGKHLPVVMSGSEAPPLIGKGEIYSVSRVRFDHPVGLQGVRENLARFAARGASTQASPPSKDLLPAPPPSSSIAQSSKRKSSDDVESVNEFGRRVKKSSTNTNDSLSSRSTASTTSTSSSSISSGYMRSLASKME